MFKSLKQKGRYLTWWEVFLLQRRLSHSAVKCVVCHLVVCHQSRKKSPQNLTNFVKNVLCISGRNINVPTLVRYTVCHLVVCVILSSLSWQTFSFLPTIYERVKLPSFPLLLPANRWCHKFSQLAVGQLWQKTIYWMKYIFIIIYFLDKFSTNLSSKMYSLIFCRRCCKKYKNWKVITELNTQVRNISTYCF